MGVPQQVRDIGLAFIRFGNGCDLYGVLVMLTHAPCLASYGIGRNPSNGLFRWLLSILGPFRYHRKGLIMKTPLSGYNLQYVHAHNYRNSQENVGESLATPGKSSG